MTGKELKNAKKNYKAKIKRTQKVRKILDGYHSYYDKMTQIVGATAKDVLGTEGLLNHERKNVEAAVWLNTLTGGSPIGMVDCLLNLVVAEEKATTEQAERKALEIEKMFKVILDFDISKLKYKNGDDFLKNASERIMFGAFATDLPHRIKSYRKLVELGKLKDPVNSKLINEVEARADLIATTMTRTQHKLGFVHSLAAPKQGQQVLYGEKSLV